MPAPGPLRDADSDEALMQAYGAGAAAAFDRLYARHKGGVFRYLLRHCGQHGVAEELFQDVWLRVIRARASYAPTAKFTTWLYTLARHRLVDHWRAHGQVGFVALVDEVDDAADCDAQVATATLAAAPGDEPETRAAAREIGRRLAAALAALPPAQRDAFLLQQEAGLSLAEIAATTAVGTETVKSRLRYATARLRAALEDLR